MILIIGAGIGGLTLALKLHSLGISSRIYESVPVLKPLGVGINILPHAMRELCGLGLEQQIAQRSIETREVQFYNRFGQHIFTDKRGRFAGYKWPQFSIHRGMLQSVLVEAVLERMGHDAIITDHRLIELEQTEIKVKAVFERTTENNAYVEIYGDVLIGCDGIHSTVRRKLNPKDNDPLIYSGITMWRGVTRWPKFLNGATMIYAGWLQTGKVIAYPIEEEDVRGNQLINWLCEFYCPARNGEGDWGKQGKLEDFIWACDEMNFDWLDIPAMVRNAEFVFEYPMVDRNPLAKWTEGRTTLLGDAAHPMYPRGSNGAGQAILDAIDLAKRLSSCGGYKEAFAFYENERRPKTTEVVHANRTVPPDAILKVIYDRTGDKPFQKIDDIIGSDELESIADNYKTIAGFDLNSLET